MVLGFQNCSNSMSFSGAGELVAKAGSTETDIETILDDGPINVGDGAPLPTPAPTSPTPPSTRPPSHSDPDRDHVGNDDEDCDDDENSDSSNPRGNTLNALRYVCVLEGPGHSIKVGFSEGVLAGQVSTPKDVCMTESACLNIISTKFEVKAVKQAGFCNGKNPHVIPMTDAQISAALAQAELQKEIELSQQQLQLSQRLGR